MARFNGGGGGAQGLDVLEKPATLSSTFLVGSAAEAGPCSQLSTDTPPRCPTHDQVAQVPLVVKEAQLLGLQAHTCPCQAHGEDQGPELLCHFPGIRGSVV